MPSIADTSSRVPPYLLEIPADIFIASPSMFTLVLDVLAVAARTLDIRPISWDFIPKPVNESDAMSDARARSSPPALASFNVAGVADRICWVFIPANARNSWAWATSVAPNTVSAPIFRAWATSFCCSAVLAWVSALTFDTWASKVAATSTGFFTASNVCRLAWVIPAPVIAVLLASCMALARFRCAADKRFSCAANPLSFALVLSSSLL